MWRLRVEGRENMVSGETYVIVANHASAADILVVYRLFRHFKWVSKVENFLTQEEEQAVVEAIRLAELSTSGEIRVHIEKETSLIDQF